MSYLLFFYFTEPLFHSCRCTFYLWPCAIICEAFRLSIRNAPQLGVSVQYNEPRCITFIRRQASRLPFPLNLKLRLQVEEKVAATGRLFNAS